MSGPESGFVAVKRCADRWYSCYARGNDHPQERPDHRWKELADEREEMGGEGCAGCEFTAVSGRVRKLMYDDV